MNPKINTAVRNAVYENPNIWQNDTPKKT